MLRTKTPVLLLAMLLLCVTAAGVTHSQPPSPLPDLTISKVHDHTAPFFQGQVGATYSITVTNNSTTATTAGDTVTVTDTLPASMTATGFGGPGWTCAALPTLSCTRTDSLGAGVSYPAITLTVNVSDHAPVGPNAVTNTAKVSTTGAEASLLNNNANDPTDIAGRPDLSITKSHSGSFFQGQAGATYTITVKNVGGADTTAPVTVVDTLPTGLTPISATWPPGAPVATCTISGQTVTCTRSDTLASGASYPPITLTVNVADNAPFGTNAVTNTATVSGGGDIDDSIGDPGVETDTEATANDPTTIDPRSDVSIAKTHTGNFTQGQVGATYTITVTNIGGASTSGTTTVTDSLPAGLTATAIAGSGWICTAIPAGGTPGPATLTCTSNAVITGGNSFPVITLTVNVAEDAPSTVSNCASVSGNENEGTGPGIETDPDTACDPTIIFQRHDTFQVNYFAGARGSRPDQTVRITNPGTRVEADGTTADMCANIYVFSPDQQLAECCSCFVSPNGLRTLSLDFDLANNPLTPVVLGEGVIKIVSSEEFEPTGNPGTVVTSKGACLQANGPGAGQSTAASSYQPIPALRAWGTHNQDVSSSGSLSGPGVINTQTETHFLEATLSQAELTSLQTNCRFIQNQGSGAGRCTCGRGD